MTLCKNRQTKEMPEDEPTLVLVCACDIDIVGLCHVHETDDGIRFIGSKSGTLVLGVRR